MYTFFWVVYYILYIVLFSCITGHEGDYVIFFFQYLELMGAKITDVPCVCPDDLGSFGRKCLSPLYINFVEIEDVLDSLARELHVGTIV
jgi:hypothetical protein